MRIFLAMMFVAACAPGPATKTSLLAATAPHSRRIAIHYAIRGREFPLPIAHVTVAGEPTLALVDTGANSHVMAGWLARKAKITTVAMGDSGTDHTGRAIETRRAPHPSIAIEGWGDLPDEPVLVTDVPDAFVKLGIGLFLSPQQLARKDVPVIFDLQERELRESAGDDDLAKTVHGLVKLTNEPAHACIDEESPVRGRAFVVKGAINHQTTTLLLDTGTPRTDLLQSSEAGKALLEHSEPSPDPVYAASGRVTPRTVKQASVAIGELSRVVDVDLIDGKLDPFCPRDGVVGMDVLATCALVFETRDVHVFCNK